MSIEIWLFIFFTVGTFLGYTLTKTYIVTATIEALIENKIIRTGKDEEGEVEILKYDGSKII